MDDVVVEAEQRRQLHEAADHMLDIYRTLARMKYIEYDWIVQGPHDISNLVSVYRGFGLHDSVIYLYSILPYIDNGSSVGVDFYGGGETADFRREEDVEQGRNPLFEQGEEGFLRPWMTPLSLIGNHQTTLIYSTKDHCIWVLAQDAVGSVDPILNDLAICQPGHDEQPASSSDADVGSDKWGDSDDEDEKCAYERMYHRPAGDVLRHINQLYLELKEIPGTGKHASSDWDASITAPLYSKHGWPGEQFDGNAFLVDLTRENARRNAKAEAEEPLQRLRRIRHVIGDDDESMWDSERMRIEAATTLEDEWVERWRLFHAQLVHRRVKKQLKGAEDKAAKLCPGGIAQKPYDVPIWEAEMLRVEMNAKRRRLERTQDKMNNARQSGHDHDRSLMIRLGSAEKGFSIAEEAYRAAKTEADGLYMGKSFKEVTGREPLDPKFGVVEDVETNRSDINEINEFIAQLPAGATRAKEEAELTIFALS